MKQWIALLALFLSLQSYSQKWDNLAPTPPMGWNSWNTFQTNISEDLVKHTADVMAASGMKDAGYTYLVLDDGWMAMERDSVTGDLVPDPKKFPHGMKAVSDYVHAKGLKFGLYNCAGTKTCAGYPGTRGYEYQDARLYAKLGIDYLKFDWCYADGENAKEAYTTMSKALKKAGRPIVFSLCEWGSNKPWEWAAPVGQLWRATGDIGIFYDSAVANKDGWKPNSVMGIVDQEAPLNRYAGKNHWNDPDMLEVGNGLTESEDRTHFSMWCMLAAPLIAGNDITKMTPQTKAMLTDKDVIAIDQDTMGVQGFRYAKQDNLETWAKPLGNGDWAVCFLNRGSTPVPVSFDWTKEKIADTVPHTMMDGSVYKIKNVWTKKAMGTTGKPFTASVASHDVVLLRLTKG